MQYQVVPQVVPPTVIGLFVNLIVGWLSASRRRGKLGPSHTRRKVEREYYYSGRSQTHIIVTLSVVALVLAKDCRCTSKLLHGKSGTTKIETTV